MNMRYLLPLALLFAAPACGEDDPPPPSKAGAPGAKPGAKSGKAPPQIAPRVRVEDRVLTSFMAELDGLVGMDDVKHEVKLVTALLQVQI